MGGSGGGSYRWLTVELLEETHVEHVVDAGTRRQLQAGGDLIDELGDVVGPIEAGAQLPSRGCRQGQGHAVAHTQPHAIPHLEGDGLMARLSYCFL
jgi:hypothetical protein